MFPFLLLEPLLQLTRRTLVSRSQRLALREDSLATNVHSLGKLQSPVPRGAESRETVVLAVGMVATHGVARVPPRLRQPLKDRIEDLARFLDPHFVFCE